MAIANLTAANLSPGQMAGSGLARAVSDYGARNEMGRVGAANRLAGMEEQGNRDLKKQIDKTRRRAPYAEGIRLAGALATLIPGVGPLAALGINAASGVAANAVGPVSAPVEGLSGAISAIGSRANFNRVNRSPSLRNDPTIDALSAGWER